MVKQKSKREYLFDLHSKQNIAVQKDYLRSGNQELIKFSHNISKFIKLLAKRNIVEIIGQIAVQSSFCNQVEHNTSNLGGLPTFETSNVKKCPVHSPTNFAKGLL